MKNNKKDNKKMVKNRQSKYKTKDPKVKYQYIPPAEGGVADSLMSVYDIVFDEVMKSQDWNFKFGHFGRLEVSYMYRVRPSRGVPSSSNSNDEELLLVKDNIN